MKVGDLVRLSFAEGIYHALVAAHDETLGDHGSFYFLFCEDGSIEAYTQETFDYGEVEVEVVSPSRKE